MIMNRSRFGGAFFLSATIKSTLFSAIPRIRELASSRKGEQAYDISYKELMIKHLHRNSLAPKLNTHAQSCLTTRVKC